MRAAVAGIAAAAHRRSCGATAGRDRAPESGPPAGGLRGDPAGCARRPGLATGPRCATTCATPVPPHLLGTDPGTAPWSFPTGRRASSPLPSSRPTARSTSGRRRPQPLRPGPRRARRCGASPPAASSTPHRRCSQPEPGVGASLVLGSGDEILLRVRTDPDVPESERVVWELRTDAAAGRRRAQLVSWWEGSPNVGPDGTIYQGNTGGAVVRHQPRTARSKWATEAANAVWTVPVVDDPAPPTGDRSTARIFALEPRRRARSGSAPPSATSRRRRRWTPAACCTWARSTASVYALDSRRRLGASWKFQTGDHIYSSPALIEDADGDPRSRSSSAPPTGCCTPWPPTGTRCGPTTPAPRSAARRSSAARPMGGPWSPTSASANGQVVRDRRHRRARGAGPSTPPPTSPPWPPATS